MFDDAVILGLCLGGFPSFFCRSIHSLNFPGFRQCLRHTSSCDHLLHRSLQWNLNHVLHLCLRQLACVATSCLFPVALPYSSCFPVFVIQSVPVWLLVSFVCTLLASVFG